MVRNSAKYQYYSTIGVNIIAIIYGISCGWSSPTFPILKSDATPIPSGPLSDADLSWVASVMGLGGLVGSIIFGYLVDIIGRRLALWMLLIPNLLCFVLTIWAQNVYYLLVARFLGGIGGGGTFIVVPLYIAEIAEDRIRGTLSSKLVFSCNIGILLAFIIGHFCSYTTSAIIYVCMPLLYFLAIMKLPETPYYLLKQNKVEEAAKSLAFFRNVQNDVDIDDEYKMELENLKSLNGGGEIKVIDESMNATYKDFVTKPALKAIGIGVGLMVLNQGCGVFAMLNYTATIFIEGGSNLSPNMSAIIVGIIQLIGSYISTILVESSGRKYCLTVSSFGTAIGLATMGTYQYLKMNEYDLTPFSWIPVASFSFILFIASLGVLTLPFVVLAEIMPEKIRASAVSMAMSVAWSLCFISIKYIYQLFEIFGMHGASFIFAGISFLGTLFIIFCVPETKGKSFDEIQQLLE